MPSGWVRKLSSADSVSSVSSNSSVKSFKSASSFRSGASRWCRKNCQNCNMVFCGEGEFCTHECRLSFSVRDYPEEAIDERLQDLGGLACHFD